MKLKVSRSLKMMRGAAIRTRKLARDMLLFWKRIDKERWYSSFLLYYTLVVSRVLLKCVSMHALSVGMR